MSNKPERYVDPMTPRTRWFLYRAIRFVAMGFLVLTIIFILPRIMPGDPIENLLGEASVGLNEEAKESLLAHYKLDRPIWEQYISFLQSIFTFDFGYSITRSMDVGSMISRRLPWTIALTLPPIIIGSFLAICVSVYCGLHRGKLLDKILTTLSIYIQTIPGFLIAMIAILIFSFKLGIFPLGHLNSGEYSGVEKVIDTIYHLTLPILVLTISVFLGKFLILRNSVIQISGENYIFVAKSKGLTEDQVMMRHVLRNIMPIFLSMLIMNIGFMITGALMVELVFSLQGMGTMLYDAISAQDYPAIQGAFIIVVLWVLLMNIVAEFLYGVADPRVGDNVDKRAGL